MRPSTASSARPRTAAVRPETTRFRCVCGRSVAAQQGSEAATSGRCSRCRARQRSDAPLHRT